MCLNAPRGDDLERVAGDILEIADRVVVPARVVGPGDEPIRAVIGDDHPVLRPGLRGITEPRAVNIQWTRSRVERLVQKKSNRADAGTSTPAILARARSALVVTPVLAVLALSSARACVQP